MKLQIPESLKVQACGKGLEIGYKPDLDRPQAALGILARVSGNPSVMHSQETRTQECGRSHAVRTRYFPVPETRCCPFFPLPRWPLPWQQRQRWEQGRRVNTSAKKARRRSVQALRSHKLLEMS